MINKKKYLIIGILFLLTISLLGTFAWYTFGTKKSSLSLVLGADEALLVTLSPFELDALADPVTSYSGMTDYVNIMASNTKSSQVKFQLFYDIEDIDTELSSTSLKYAVTRSAAQNGTYTEVATGTFSNTDSGDHKIIYEETISAYTIYYYRIYTYIDGTQPNSSELQGHTLIATMGAEMSNTLYENISKNADTTTQIDFSKTSEQDNTSGIYTYTGENTEGAYPIYFYRGAVTNNNVKFANRCWKIVRTTGTGGVKLIYNGEYTDEHKCDDEYVEPVIDSPVSYNSNGSSRYLSRIGYMNGSIDFILYDNTMTSISDVYLYGNSFTWNGSNYTLVDTISFAGTAWNSNRSRLTNYHYTCFNTTGVCSSIKYISYTSSSYATYLSISNGKSISDVLNIAVINPSNTVNSGPKDVVDNWYSSNMTTYTSYLEDTIYCSNRRIYQLGGFDPDGGNVTDSERFSFGSYEKLRVTYSPSVKCNKNDSFTVSDTTRGNGALTYPAALLTADEMVMAGGKWNTYNATYYLCSSKITYGYWTMSPYANSEHYFMISRVYGYSGSYYDLNMHGMDAVRSVRPVISLNHNNYISGGNGTVNNPFIIE